MKNRITELQQSVYVPDVTFKLLPKCNLCNDNRQLVAKFPNGKIATISCDCNKTITYYEPVKYSLFSIVLDKQQNFTKVMFKSEINNLIKLSDIAVFESFQNFQNAKESKKIDTYSNIGFTTQEECQLYCNLMNEHIDNTKGDID